jgi:hypothetical protein
MRIFAIHDAAGVISEVITCPEDAPVPVLTTQPGLSMTEIEVPGGVADTELESSQGLTELTENYRVEVVTGKSPLVPR